MPAQMLFYHGGPLRDLLATREAGMRSEIEKATEQQLLSVDIDQWAGALARRWSLKVPVLDREAMYMDPHQEIKVDVRHDFLRSSFNLDQPHWYPGFRVTVHIPFDGDPRVFDLQPSSFTFNPPSGTVSAADLRYVVEYLHDAAPDIGPSTQEFLNKVQQYLEFASDDIAAANGRLKATAVAAITARRSRAQANYERLQASGIPIGGPLAGAKDKQHIVDAVIRRAAPALPDQRLERPLPLEPALANEHYEHILEVARSIGLDMEHSPATFTAMGEEDRRNILLGALNTHYRGAGTAEAFNVSGKTDILIRHEGQTLFIAECKIWDGVQTLLDALDQLFGYQAWRDSKLAIVVFVNQRNLSEILKKARLAIQAAENFVEWRQAATEFELRCTVSWPGDQERLAALNILFVHTPPPRGRTKKATGDR